MNKNIDHIYHGCFTKNKDGTNRIIKNGQICFWPTNSRFWKYPEDVPSGVKTRSQHKEQKLVKPETFDRYFRQKNKVTIRRWMTAEDSDVQVLKESDTFYIVC